MIGKKYSMVTVLGYVGSIVSKATKRQYVECRCECGSICIASTYAIRSGTTKSCGCYKSISMSQIMSTHKQTKTGVEASPCVTDGWAGMASRPS